MTAFARGSEAKHQSKADIEIRSYNSKNLDIVAYLPKSCREFEDRIKKQAAQRISRGRVEIHLSFEDNSEDAFLFDVDESRARGYYQALKNLGICFLWMLRLPWKWSWQEKR